MKYFRNILVLVVLLALLDTSQPVLVRADELPAATDTGTGTVINTNALTTLVSPMVTRDYPFSVVIPVTSYVYSDWYDMSPGKYVQAELDSSDGHNVFMTVVDADTLQPLGSEVPFYSTGTKTLWTNRASTTYRVKVRFGADAWARVPASGFLHFGQY